MSKFGETVDSILELLQKEEKMSLKEFNKKMHLIDQSILDFMKENGLIEIEHEYIRIAGFGLELQTEE